MSKQKGLEVNSGVLKNLITVLFLVLLGGNTAMAQIEEIIVTAQKRSENLQSVPISISAQTMESLEKYGVGHSPLDLQLVTPGLQTTQVVSGFAPRIRGVGSTDSTPGNENSVSVYVDGVYIPGSANGLVSLSNAERIEVLKGPQGTLFGRNTTGGVIHIITRDPSHETAGDISVSYGKFDTTVVNGYATTGLSENIAVDISGRWEDQADGWGTNIATGREAYKRESSALRSKVLITPRPDTAITLSADYYDYEDDFAPFALRNHDPADFYNTNQDLDSFMNGKVWGLSARIEYEFDWATLVSISAYRDIEQGVTMDIDNGPSPLLAADFQSHGKSFTQEIQLLSPDSSDYQWIVGLYYFDREAMFKPGLGTGLFLGLEAPPLSHTETYNKQDTESIAIFAQTTFPLSENANLTFGLRYTEDEQKFRGHVIKYPLIPGPVIITPTTPAEGDRLKDDKLTYRIALDYHFTQDIMGYISFNTGFKSGFFNISGSPASSTGPEFLDAFEIGVKSEFFDNRLRLNMAAYAYDFEDVQAQYIKQGQAVAVNAEEATIYGLEAETIIVPVEFWNIRFGFNYMPEAKYNKFDPCPGPQPPLGPGVYECDGSRMVNAPRWDVSLGTDYTIYSAIGTFNLALAYQYMSKFPWDADFGIVPGYNTELYKESSNALLNLNGKWVSPDEHISVALWAKNLTGEEYYVNANQSSGSITGGLFGDGHMVGMPGAPRTYGITLGYKFF